MAIYEFDDEPEIIRETDKAVLYAVRTGVNNQSYTTREVWIPRSIITTVDRAPYHPTIQIPFWFAKKNGIN